MQILFLSHSLNLISRSLDMIILRERLIKSRERHNILRERLIKFRERVTIYYRYLQEKRNGKNQIEKLKSKINKSFPQDIKSFPRDIMLFSRLYKSLPQDIMSFPRLNKSFPQLNVVPSRYYVVPST